MTLNEEKNVFSDLAASRRSTRAFTDREMPAGMIDAILADATTAPSWSNTRAFRVAIASGARAQRLQAFDADRAGGGAVGVVVGGNQDALAVFHRVGQAAGGGGAVGQF